MPANNLGPWSPQTAVNTDYTNRLIVGTGETAAGAVLQYTFNPTGSASLDTDIIVDDKCEVLDVIVRKDGTGTGNTIQIKNGSTAISDAIVAAVDKAITRAGTLDKTQTVIAAGGTLRCSAVRSALVIDCLVTVVVALRP